MAADYFQDRIFRIETQSDLDDLRYKLDTLPTFTMFPFCRSARNASLYINAPKVAIWIVYLRNNQLCGDHEHSILLRITHICS